MNRSPIWRHAILLPLACVFALPMIVLVSGSLKTRDQLSRNPHSIVPGDPSFSNYSEAVEAMPLLRYATNSFVLCLGSVIGSLLIPWHVTMIPRFLLISKLGMYNSHWAIIVPTFFGDAFYIFLLRQFFLTLPDDLFEAGQIDGMSHWQMFLRIALPLSIPALVTVGLFKFIEVWNDFGSPLLFLNDPEKFPLAYGLERFVSSYADQTNLLLAIDR